MFRTLIMLRYYAKTNKDNLFVNAIKTQLSLVIVMAIHRSLRTQKLSIVYKYWKMTGERTRIMLCDTIYWIFEVLWLVPLDYYKRVNSDDTYLLVFNEIRETIILHHANVSFGWNDVFLFRTVARKRYGGQQFPSQKKRLMRLKTMFWRFLNTNWKSASKVSLTVCKESYFVFLSNFTFYSYNVVL